MLYRDVFLTANARETGHKRRIDMADEMAYLAYGLAWVATSAGVCLAIYFTHSLWPLFAFIFPGSISLTKSEEQPTIPGQADKRP